MKLAIVALSTAAMIVSAPAVFAQGVASKTPRYEIQKHGKKLAIVPPAKLGVTGCGPIDRMRAVREFLAPVESREDITKIGAWRRHVTATANAEAALPSD